MSVVSQTPAKDTNTNTIKESFTKFPLAFQSALNLNHDDDDNDDMTSNNDNDNDKDGEINDLEKIENDSPIQYVTIDINSKEYNEMDMDMNMDMDQKTDLKQLFQLTPEYIKAATQRCALVRYAYRIVARGKTYQELAENALISLDEDGTSLLGPYFIGGKKENATWCIRLRDFSGIIDAGGDDDEEASPTRSRYGKNMKSPLARERQAILEMKELALTLGGDVKLKSPDLKLYVLEGLTSPQRIGEEEKILAIRLAEGPKVS